MQRALPGACDKEEAADLDEVTQVQQLDTAVDLFSQIVHSEVNLDTACAVLDLGEGGLAHLAQKPNAPDNGVRALGTFKLGEVCQELGDGMCTLSIIRIRVNALFAQCIYAL